VDGRPQTGLTFFFARVKDCADDLRAFARAGIDFFSACIGFRFPAEPDAGPDFGYADELFEYVLSANPRALILPRVMLGRYRPPDWWLARHGDDRQVDLPVEGGEPRRIWVALASEAWRREAADALRAYIRHCERRWGDHVLGYHLAAGEAGEFSYSWSPMLSDYSAPHRGAYRAWLRRRYGGDEAALRAAWGDPAASFETAVAPPPDRRLRRPGDPSLFDPACDRAVTDYLRFHSEVMAETLVHFCGLAKEALRELGAKKVVGAFYGYHFKNLNRPANFHNTGHFAPGLVLDSPDVDFVCAPYCYQGREHGHMYLAQLVAGSVRLRGKLYWCEDDTFTFRSRRQPDRSWCPDRGTTIGVLRRNLAGVLRDGGTAWWMDCGGNGSRRPGEPYEGWYADEGLMQNFAAMQRLAQERLGRGDYTPAAQVAVLLSDSSAVYHRQDAALMDALIIRQMFEVAALGASFDTYRVADLGRLMAQPWSANYRFLIFPDALALSDAERQVLRQEVQKDGRTILWTYGAGIVTDAGLSPEAMADATGIRAAVRWRDEPLLVTTFATGSRVLYGTERPISPVLYGADAEADVKGWLLNTAEPGFLVKDLGGWRSVWSAAPAVPAAVLRAIARQAGVHLYVETGEQVLAERGLLSLHAAFTGERTVRLPGPADVADAYTGRAVGAGITEFRAAMERGSTATWAVRPAARDVT
jgi:hypothetical protein